ncbi:hypothetical protein AKJ57_00810 [candidate division MSBL1 archaeon SCGC-AAA259A05]|uniref:Uncharacterized protein n=1 Tax=candidate division MSBL1 archaeon SCGC-AAA259A05 TaxID=1698259 RepID=A0A133UBG1_9EURY|nr:hypothetical protein AKJ57_00810 [candidate division MSBL1 archaeon SCGC-AAA259A05]
MKSSRKSAIKTVGLVILIITISAGIISVMDWDKDRLKNYEEILGPTDWRNYDTDGDQQNDSKDPYPLVHRKWTSLEEKVDELREKIDRKNEIINPFNQELEEKRK